LLNFILRRQVGFFQRGSIANYASCGIARASMSVHLSFKQSCSEICGAIRIGLYCQQQKFAAETLVSGDIRFMWFFTEVPWKWSVKLENLYIHFTAHSHTHTHRRSLVFRFGGANTWWARSANL